MTTCSSTSPFSELQNQLGYVQCSFCATFLLVCIVSIPCSSLLKVVTVKCGHCSAEMQEENSKDADEEKSTGEVEQAEEEMQAKESSPPTTLTINKLSSTLRSAPEKRQRAPSAYNRFIKYVLYIITIKRVYITTNEYFREEIQRIKARDPGITHKEAFSTAAKNQWAQFPRFQQGEIGEGCSTMRDGKKAREEIFQIDGRKIVGFSGGKELRHAI
uniref:YABBY protein n=1 Tax=Apostasia shenzhenica TaxID=1088818 RepID=A0A7S8F9B1_9ASPA|nr:YABBY protein [Apostasia shenzhenica]